MKLSASLTLTSTDPDGEPFADLAVYWNGLEYRGVKAIRALIAEAVQRIERGLAGPLPPGEMEVRLGWRVVTADGRRYTRAGRSIHEEYRTNRTGLVTVTRAVLASLVELTGLGQIAATLHGEG